MRTALGILLALTAAACAGPRTASSPSSASAPRSQQEWSDLTAQYVAERRPALSRCYEAEVQRVEEGAASGLFQSGKERVPPLVGSLALVVPFHPDGTARDPRIERDTMRNARVNECLFAEARGWRTYPIPAREVVEVEIPLVFNVRVKLDTTQVPVETPAPMPE